MMVSQLILYSIVYFCSTFYSNFQLLSIDYTLLGDIIVSENDVHLLDSGAVGAFIQGLEDEFGEVRNAAVDSICELSMRSDRFGRRAVDFLVGT